MDDILNQRLSIIEHIIIKDKLPHALLLEVDNCDDGLSFAKNISKLILCSNSNKSINTLNCSNCNICNIIDSNNHPDLKIISADGNWIKKQQLIDLQEEFNNKSILNNKRIYIISEADKLNASSSNSLLKFLEEPEDDIIAILLTTNRYLLLDTIISRCQIFNLKKSDYNINPEYLNNVTNFIEYLVKKRNLFVDYKCLFENIFVDKKNTKILLAEVEKYFLSYLIGDCKDDYLKEKLNDIFINDIILYVKIIEKEKQKLEYNVNFKIWLDCFFSRIIGEVYGGNSSSNS